MSTPETTAAPSTPTRPGGAHEDSESTPAEVEPIRVTLLIAFVACLAGAALALSADSIWMQVTHRGGTVALFSMIAIALQMGTIRVYGRGSLGFAGTALLAVAIVLGVGIAMVVAALVAAVNVIRRRGRLERGVFDAGQLVLAVGAAGGVYEFAGGGQSSQARTAAVTVLAGIVFYCVNTGLLSLAMGASEGLHPASVWTERFRWMAPYYAISGPLALACSEAYDRLGAVGLLAFTAPPGFMMISVHQYVKRTESSVVRLREANEELERRAEKIRRTHFATIGALARSMEAKDGYTGGHTERVSDVAVALAVRLGFEGDELDAIRTGALLHDIGKIGIPEQIINKPGPLDEDEWAVMKTHPVISEYILAEAGLHEFVCQAARSSHEAVDGSGYPDGLVGEEIPLPARIAAVADTLDALTSDRSYRKSRSLDQAMEEVRKHTGTQFCPRVVAALEQVYAEEPETLVDAAPTPHLAAAA